MILLRRGIVDQNDTEFRDHCWIPLKGAITKVVPTINKNDTSFNLKLSEKSTTKTRLLTTSKTLDQ